MQIMLKFGHLKPCAGAASGKMYLQSSGSDCKCTGAQLSAHIGCTLLHAELAACWLAWLPWRQVLALVH